MVLPIYRDADNLQSIAAPATAALVAIEMGRPFLYGLIILAIFGAYVLFRRALSRGRDYYYAGCGAGIIAAMAIASFSDAGLLISGHLFSPLQRWAWRSLKANALAMRMDWMSQPNPLQFRSSRQGMQPVSSTPAQTWFRGGLLVFSALLALLSAWIIVAEYYRPPRIQLLADRQASLPRGDSVDQQNARRAASIARVRGDLWAESAFTHSDLLWREPPTTQDTGGEAGNDTRLDLENAIRYAPHRGDVWLMLAAMAERYHWQGSSTGRFAQDVILYRAQ